MAKLGGGAKLYTEESLPFFFDEEKMRDFSALRNYDCLTLAQLAFLIPASLPSRSDSSIGKSYLHYINLVLADVAARRLDPKHPETLIPNSEYRRMAKAGYFGNDAAEMPLPTADWLVSLEDAGKWSQTKGICLDFDDLRSAYGKSKTENSADSKGKKEPNNWKMLIQRQAAEIWRKYKSMDCSPTKNSIKADLARWCRDNKIESDSGIIPSESYIYRHVLSGWEPPKD